MRFGALGAPMFLTCSECRRTAKLAAVGRYTFVIPSVFPPSDEEDLYTLTEPFNATGHWTVDVQGCEGTTARFDRDIVASGNVRFVLGAERSTGNSIISALVYEFAEPAPVAEPSTLILCGPAAATVASRTAAKRREPSHDS